MPSEHPAAASSPSPWEVRPVCCSFSLAGPVLKRGSQTNAGTPPKGLRSHAPGAPLECAEGAPAHGPSRGLCPPPASLLRPPERPRSHRTSPLREMAEDARRARSLEAGRLPRLSAPAHPQPVRPDPASPPGSPALSGRQGRSKRRDSERTRRLRKSDCACGGARLGAAAARPVPGSRTSPLRVPRPAFAPRPALVS